MPRIGSIYRAVSHGRPIEANPALCRVLAELGGEVGVLTTSSDGAAKLPPDIVNAHIKRREWFRPFAPSILEERTGDYFEESYPVPYMLQVYTIRPEKRAELPAVTHEDGTGRLQTVSARNNPLYYRLIKTFGEQTGTPVVLNTSFNENEPIVNTPEEAVDCFVRTKMDVLVLGKGVVRKSIVDVR